MAQPQAQQQQQLLASARSQQLTIAGKPLASILARYNDTRFQTQKAVLTLPGPPGAEPPKVQFQAKDEKLYASLDDSTLEQAKKYDIFTGGAMATCLVLGVSDTGGKKRAAGKKERVTLQLLLLNVVKYAKDENKAILKTGQNGLALPPRASLWWRVDVLDEEATPQVYRDVQVVLRWLDKKHRKMVDDLVEKAENEKASGKKQAPATGGNNTLDLNTTPEVLLRPTTKMSKFVRDNYLPHCQWNAIPDCSKNAPPSKKKKAAATAATGSAAVQAPPPTTGWVDVPSDDKAYEDKVIELLKTELVTNMVVYLIHLNRNCKRIEKSTDIELLTVFRVTMDKPSNLKPRTEVNVTGVESGILITPMNVKYDQETNLPIEYDPKPNLKARGLELLNGGKAYYPAVIHRLRMVLQLTKDILPNIEELARENDLDQRSAELKREMTKSKDVYLPLSATFIPKSAARTRIASLDPNDLTTSTKLDSFITFSYDPKAASGAGNHWVSEPTDAYGDNPDQPPTIQLKVTLSGYQLKRPLVEYHSRNKLERSVSHGILSQPEDDGSNDSTTPNNGGGGGEYRVYFNELTRIGGQLKSFHEACCTFGFDPTYGVDAYGDLMPVFFKYLKGGFTGYVEYFKTVEKVAPSTIPDDMPDEVRPFFESHLCSDSVDGRPYLQVEKDEVTFAVAIASKIAQFSAVYSAVASSWEFDYAEVIRDAGVHVSRDVCLRFLNNPERSACVTLPSLIKDVHDIVFLTNDSGQRADYKSKLTYEKKVAADIPSADTHDFYLIYKDLESKDKETIKEAAKKITPAISDLLYSDDFLNLPGPEEYIEYLTKHQLNRKVVGVDFTTLIFTFKTVVGVYAFAVPKNHDKVCDDQINRIIKQASSAMENRKTFQTVAAALPTAENEDQADKKVKANNAVDRLETLPDDTIIKNAPKQVVLPGDAAAAPVVTPTKKKVAVVPPPPPPPPSPPHAEGDDGMEVDREVSQTMPFHDDGEGEINEADSKPVNGKKRKAPSSKKTEEATGEAENDDDDELQPPSAKRVATEKKVNGDKKPLQTPTSSLKRKEKPGTK